MGIDDLVDHFLAFTDHEGIYKGVHRLWIEGSMPASNHQGVFGGALGGEEGDASQVEQVKGVGVEGFVRQREAENVKFGQGMPGFQRI